MLRIGKPNKSNHRKITRYARAFRCLKRYAL